MKYLVCYEQYERDDIWKVAASGHHIAGRTMD